MKSSPRLRIGLKHAAEKLEPGSLVSGRGFSHADRSNEMNGALAPAPASSRVKTPGAPSIRRFLANGWETTKAKSLFLKSAQALLLAIAVTFSLGATDASSRFNDLGHRLMCTCGCAQLLGECNHVGCPESGREREELKAQIASGKTDQQILDWFAAKYGATMLAAPTMQGFNLVAWIAPFAVLAAGFLGTFLLVRRWSVGKTPLPSGASIEANLDPEERERRERIRRDTGMDGDL